MPVSPFHEKAGVAVVIVPVGPVSVGAAIGKVKVLLQPDELPALLKAWTQAT